MVSTHLKFEIPALFLVSFFSNIPLERYIFFQHAYGKHILIPALIPTKFTMLLLLKLLKTLATITETSNQQANGKENE